MGKREFTRKAAKITSHLFAMLFVVTGTTAVVLYANGYRPNRIERTFEKTGVLSIESDPSRGTIFLEGEEIGRSSKTVTGLKPTSYTVRLTHENYHEWSRDVYVEEEKSTPVYPFMVLRNPLLEEMFTFENEIVDVASVYNDNYIFVVTKEILPPIVLTGETVEDDSDASTAAEEADSGNDTEPEETADVKTASIQQIRYTLWRYTTNPSFWQTSDNPVVVDERVVTDEGVYTILPDPTGDSVIITYTDDSETKISELLKIPADDETENISLTGFLDGYTSTWGKDGQYIMLESEDELVAVDASSGIKYLLRKEKADGLYTTDESGNIYIVSEQTSQDTDETEAETYYTISKSGFNGTVSDIVIDRIFAGVEREEELPELAGRSYEELPEISLTDEGSMYIDGPLVSIDYLEQINAFILKTSSSLYLYDVSESTYLQISNRPADFMSLSPNEEQILYYDTEGRTLMTYRIEKVSADHTKTYGSRAVRVIENPDETKILWHNNSHILLFHDQTDDIVRIIDVKGDNEQILFQGNLLFFAKKASNDEITVITQEATVPTHKIFEVGYQK